MRQNCQDKTKLYSYFIAEKKITAWIIFFGFMTNILIIWLPTFQGKLLDEVYQGFTGQVLQQHILLYLSLAVTVQVFRFFKRFLVRKLENRTVLSLRNTIYENMMMSTNETMAKESTGSLMNKLIGDVSICAEGIRKIITEIFDTGVMLLGYLMIMLSMDMKITLYSCAFIPAAIFLSKFLKNTVVSYNQQYRQAKGTMNDLLYQNVSNAITFRIYGLQEVFHKEYIEHLPDLKKKAVKASFFDHGVEPLYNVLSLTGIIFCIYLGSMNVRDGLWRIGQFSSFLMMFIAVAKKSGRVSTYINLFQKTAVSWKRLTKYLQPVIQPASAPVNTHPPITMKFENVAFSYENSPNKLFQEINLEAFTGEIIGICGPIASGKSTLLKLLTTENGYTGSITINNQELNTMTMQQKSTFMAYKGHNPELFSASIKENIVFDNQDSIKTVLEDTGLIEDINKMSQKEHSPAGSSGSNLSGGQKDRVALARTLYERKKIILLDDPFASLDQHTEAHIIDQLLENYKDAILIITSHRYHIFKYADKILYLDGSGSSQVGSHEELIQTNQEYKDICILQGVI